MTNERAKEALQYIRMGEAYYDNAIKVAIDALEKQIPRTVCLPASRIGRERYCPRCRTYVGLVDSILKSEEFGLSTYCDACGQALRSD